jgi:hypothetical protein
MTKLPSLKVGVFPQNVCVAKLDNEGLILSPEQLFLKMGGGLDVGEGQKIRIDPHAILSCWIWIQKGKKLTHKKKKIKNFHVLKYWMFSFEG